jgi:hypothetical protein
MLTVIQIVKVKNNYKADDSSAMKASKSAQKLSTTASSNVVSGNTNNDDGV